MPILSQAETVSGIRRPRRSKERALQAYRRSLIPAKRMELRRIEDLGLIREGRTQAQKQHEESLALEREGREAEKIARETSFGIARRGLDLQDRLRKEAKKQAEIGLGFQGVGLGLQAYESFRKKDPMDWTTKYQNYGYDSGSGGGGFYGFSVPGGGGVGYGTTWG